MVEQQGSYYLEHPPDVVFDYLSTPANVATLAPSLETSSQQGIASNGGPIIKATYTVGGGLAEGTATLVPEVYEPVRQIRYHIDDDIQGYIEWTFEEEDGGTRFTYDAEYEVTIPVPALFMDTVGQYISQREVDALVDNLRTELAAANPQAEQN